MRPFVSFLFFLFLSCIVDLHAQLNDTIKTQNLQSIEISGKSAPSSFNSTNLVQSITSDNLLQQGIQSVSDAIKRFNGIVLKDYGGIGGLKTVSIRGMGAEHTAVSYDGIPVNNVQSGQVDIGRFALDNISLVSFSIGQFDDIFQPAKAFASAGVLNLQTKKPDFVDKPYSGHAKVTAGSFGLFNPFMDYAYKINNAFTVTANGSWQRADGNYPFTQEDDKLIYKRKRKNSDVNIYRTELNIFGDFGNKGQLDSKIYYFNSDRGLPGKVILGLDYAVERLWDRNFFAQTSYHKNLGEKLHLKTKLKYDYNYTRYEDTWQENEVGKLTNKYREQEVYLSNALLYSLNDKMGLSIAEDLSYNSLDNELQQFGNNLAYPKRYNSFTSLAFKYKSKKITITSSLLGIYIYEKVKNNSGNTIYRKLSPSIGLSYQPFATDNLRLRASFKHIYRVPSFTEVYYSSIEKKLKPESAKQFNVGLTWLGELARNPLDYISVSVDGYYNKVDDKIVIIPTMFLPTTMNLGEVDIKGADLRLTTNYHLNTKLSLNMIVSYSYMQALDVTSKTSESYKNQIQYTPKHSGAATFTFNNPWVNFSYSMIAASNRYSKTINDKSSRVNGYTDHSLSLFRQFKLKDNQLYIQGNILNIWNNNYSVIAYYPMPGRSFKISMGYKF